LFDTRQRLCYSEAIFFRKGHMTMDRIAGFPIKAEFDKIRNLPKGKRWEYVWEYYRLAFFLFGFSLFFLFSIGSFLVNGLVNTLFPKDSFSIAFAAPGFSSSQAWQEDCLGAVGYNVETEVFQILTSAPLSDAADDFRINASVWMANGQPDIFVVNEASYQHLLGTDSLTELQQVLPEHLLSLAADRMVDAFALDVSDTPMAKAYGLTAEPVYLCMYIHGNGFDRALDLVEYILTEE